MIPKPKIFIFLFLGCLNQQSWAQFTYSKSTQEAHNAILDLNFERYDALRNHQIQDEKGIYFWLDGYKEFVNYYSSSDSCEPDSVIARIHFFLSETENLKSPDPFYFYTQTDLHLFLSFLYLEQEELFRAFQHYYYAKNLLKTCYNKYPDFEYLNKQFLIDFVINRQINLQLGIKTVSNNEAQETYIQLLSKYLQTSNSVYKRELNLLGIILFNLQNDKGFDRFIKDLDITIDFAKTGPMESLMSALLFKKAEIYTNQQIILQNAYNLGYQKNLNAITLWYGSALLNKQADSSIVFIDKFLCKQNNSKYTQYAQYKASIYWFLKDDISRSDSLNTLIKQSVNHYVSDDKQAVYEISHAEYWTKELVLSRLLFDGGEYKKSLDVLLSAKSKVANYTKEQRLEYSYRIARIYDKFNDIEKARKFYVMVINSGLDNRFYYPAYAAFYLGNLYSQNKEYTMANEYYNICTELESPIYKTTIHKKAKQAIH